MRCLRRWQLRASYGHWTRTHFDLPIYEHDCAGELKRSGTPQWVTPAQLWHMGENLFAQRDPQHGAPIHFERRTDGIVLILTQEALPEPPGECGMDFAVGEVRKRHGRVRDLLLNRTRAQLNQKQA